MKSKIKYKIGERMFYFKDSKLAISNYLRKQSKSIKISKNTFINQLNLFIQGLCWAIYQPYKWFFVVPMLAFSTIVFSTLAVISSFIISPSFASQIFAVAWARLNSFFTPMTVEVSGRQNIDKKQSYVIVANHQSFYDIYALYGWMGVDFKWVMKEELKKVPFIGSVCMAMKHVFVDRSNTKAAIASINNAKKLITGGTSVIFFPEGTRNNSGNLGTFKKGAFKFAYDLGLPVLPVTLKGTSKILPKNSLNLMPGSVELVIHEPVVFDYCEESNVKMLAEKAHDIIQNELNKL